MVLKLGHIQSLGGPTKKISRSTVWFSHSVGLEWGPIIWISIKFLHDANTAGLGGTLGERGSKPHQPVWPCRGFNVHAESKWMLTQPSSLYGAKRRNSDTFFKIHLRNHFPTCVFFYCTYAFKKTYFRLRFALWHQWVCRATSTTPIIPAEKSW